MNSIAFKALKTGLHLVTTSAIAYNVYEQSNATKEALRLKKIDRANEYLEVFRKDDYLIFSQRIMDMQNRIVKTIPLTGQLINIANAKTLKLNNSDIGKALKLERDDPKSVVIHDSIEQFLAFFDCVSDEIRLNAVDEVHLKTKFVLWLSEARRLKIDEYAKERNYNGLQYLIDKWEPK